MSKSLRVTRTRNRVYPFAWTCTLPDPESHTGECGAGSFAETEAQVAAAHAEHMTIVHANPEETP